MFFIMDTRHFHINICINVELAAVFFLPISSDRNHQLALSISNCSIVPKYMYSELKGNPHQVKKCMSIAYLNKH